MGDINWGQVFSGGVDLASAAYQQQQALDDINALTETITLGTENLSSEATTGTAFQPFTVTTGLGSTTTTDQGGFSTTLSPQAQALQNLGLSGAQGFMANIGQDAMSQLLGGQALQAYQGLGPSALTGMGVSGYQNIGKDPMQQAILAQARQGFANIGQDPRQQALLSQADTAFGRAMADPSQAQADIYGQIRATQRPEEERQSLALEERMLSQGRMGLSSSAYGGASPELLAQETARQEAMSRANLSARSQAMQEQQQAYGQGLGFLGQASGMRAQDLAEASGLLGAGYTPQTMQLAAAGAQFGAGMSQEQADLARAGTLQQASYIPQAQDLAMAQGLMGIGFTPQEQALAALGSGIDLSKIGMTGQIAGEEIAGTVGLGGLQGQINQAEMANEIRETYLSGLFDSILSNRGTGGGNTGGDTSGGGAGEGGNGLFNIGGYEVTLDDLTNVFESMFSSNDSPAPNQGQTGVEEIVPTGYDENGNPIYNYG